MYNIKCNIKSDSEINRIIQKLKKELRYIKILAVLVFI